jgi:hypothetical protein
MLGQLCMVALAMSVSVAGPGPCGHPAGRPLDAPDLGITFQPPRRHEDGACPRQEAGLLP